MSSRALGLLLCLTLLNTSCEMPITTSHSCWPWLSPPRLTLSALRRYLSRLQLSAAWLIPTNKSAACTTLLIIFVMMHIKLTQRPLASFASCGEPPRTPSTLSIACVAYISTCCNLWRLPSLSRSLTASLQLSGKLPFLPLLNLVPPTSWRLPSAHNFLQPLIVAKSHAKSPCIHSSPRPLVTLPVAAAECDAIVRDSYSGGTLTRSWILHGFLTQFYTHQKSRSWIVRRPSYPRKQLPACTA